MNIISDEKGQGAAEYVLLFGGVIVIAITALWIYRAYMNPSTPPYHADQDIQLVRSSADV